MELKVVLITCPNQAKAEEIATRIVEEKLAACTNIIPHIKSIYTWQGKIEKEEECLMVVKSISSKLKKLEKRVYELHPYSTPEFVVVEPSYVGEKYAAWVAEYLG